VLVITIIGAWLLADFISGLVHWWEDRALVGASRFEFINSVRADNERHHQTPGYFLRYTWWENINTTAPAAWLLAAVLWLIGSPPLLCLTCFFLGIGNLVHRWSHERTENRPVAVTWLQRTGLLISPSHHSGHHFVRGKPVEREDSSIRFCVMSSWLNPILDRIGFFSALERLLRWK
jgi:hypothetical protein